ncbi:MULTISPECIES: zinc dependent phospholipase C family protein [unclassified Clostridium]|uniref:zinc dependent phospholipase C family protein n=1 Tax=unclassified Clostridium TaxID=2614128 RepID=UPI0002976973|nr:MULTISPECIES: zinc dependent phospholipase C family protein [unclassified Clostridium]EKQ53286.1 MAG: hypothetical protein A370_03803 [Clostridium sp. Maddingley MBC34-26]
MKIKTHLKLAELSLIKNVPIIPEGFSMFMFNFGLVMVDQSWLVKTHPHYMQKSLEYINKKIEDLFSIKKFNSYSSMQLGVIVHYLCDFCCHSHTSGSVGNISFHLKYERELQKYLIRNFDVLKNELSFNSDFHLPTNNITTLKSAVNDRLVRYFKGDASYFWDIIHCIEISSLVCSSIFNFNLNFSNKTEYIKRQLQLSNAKI